MRPPIWCRSHTGGRWIVGSIDVIEYVRLLASSSIIPPSESTNTEDNKGQRVRVTLRLTTRSRDGNSPRADEEFVSSRSYSNNCRAIVAMRRKNEWNGRETGRIMSTHSVCRFRESASSGKSAGASSSGSSNASR